MHLRFGCCDNVFIVKSECQQLAGIEIVFKLFSFHKRELLCLKSVSEKKMAVVNMNSIYRLLFWKLLRTHYFLGRFLDTKFAFIGIELLFVFSRIKMTSLYVVSVRGQRVKMHWVDLQIRTS